jgi:hypothetical protein
MLSACIPKRHHRHQAKVDDTYYAWDRVVERERILNDAILAQFRSALAKQSGDEGLFVIEPSTADENKTSPSFPDTVDEAKFIQKRGASIKFSLVVKDQAGSIRDLDLGHASTSRFKKLFTLHKKTMKPVTQSKVRKPRSLAQSQEPFQRRQTRDLKKTLRTKGKSMETLICFCVKWKVEDFDAFNVEFSIGEEHRACFEGCYKRRMSSV